MRGAFSSVRLVAIALLAMAMVPTVQVSAQQSDGTCGEFYRIKRGDTLRALTQRVYGHDRFSLLFGANRDILNDPAQIEAGQLLFIPCDGFGVQRRSEALALAGYEPTPEDQLGTRRAGATGTPTTNEGTISVGNGEVPRLGTDGVGNFGDRTAASGSDRRIAVVSPGNAEESAGNPRLKLAPLVRELPPRLRILSADGMEPLSGRKLPGGGLVGDLIGEAFREIAPSIQIEVAFVNDRQAHLDVLVPLDSFTLSYPWPAPDCGQVSVQGAYSRDLCGNFAFSLPIYQAELRYYARRDDPAAAQISTSGDLRELSVCRPADFPPVDLERDRIGGKIVVMDTLAACVDAVVDGEVDVLSAPATMLRSSGMGQLVELEALRRQEPVHAIFARGPVESAAAREALDQGLRQIQASGAWFSSVSKYLRDYNENRLTATN